MHSIYGGWTLFVATGRASLPHEVTSIVSIDSIDSRIQCPNKLNSNIRFCKLTRTNYIKFEANTISIRFRTTIEFSSSRLFDWVSGVWCIVCPFQRLSIVHSICLCSSHFSLPCACLTLFRSFSRRNWYLIFSFRCFNAFTLSLPNGQSATRLYSWKVLKKT